MNKAMIKKSITLKQLDKKKGWSKEAKARIKANASYLMMLQELKEFKDEQGITNAEISGKTGIPRPEISNIFNGKRNATIETISRIAESFDKAVIFKLV